MPYQLVAGAKPSLLLLGIASDYVYISETENISNRKDGSGTYVCLKLYSKTALRFKI